VVRAELGREVNRVDRPLAALHTAGERGVCLADSPWPEDAYCWRNAVSEARALGHAIAGEPCTKHPHRGRVLAYRRTLQGGPAYPERTVTRDGVATAIPPAVSVVAPLLFPEPQLRGGHGR